MFCGEQEPEKLKKHENALGKIVKIIEIKNIGIIKKILKIS